MIAWLASLDWSAVLAPTAAGIFAVLVAIVQMRREVMKERQKTLNDVSKAKSEVKTEVREERREELREVKDALSQTEHALIAEVMQMRGEVKYLKQMWEQCEHRSTTLSERVAVLQDRLERSDTSK